MTTSVVGLRSRSSEAFDRARSSIVGGVNSPVRAFRAVGGDPVFFARGQGPYAYDIDGHEYVDYMLSWGPLIAGHAHPDVVAAIVNQAQLGTSFGAPTEIESTMAEEVLAAYPSIELVRMVNSGTEATMSALRLARGFTGRSLILKFSGCYHGHPDGLLIRAGSGVATLSLPDSPGVPAQVAGLTLTAPYNDSEAVRAIFQASGEQIAAVIVEPVAGNMGMVLPEPGFLQALRELTQAYGTLLIFDEVMTGFRVRLGGAQDYYGITPDLTTLGKVIGGGLPVGAYGGRREIMEQIAPLGPVYQAGTLSGNPLAMAAGLATLALLKEPGTYERLETYGGALTRGFLEAASELGIPAQASFIGAMFGTFFAPEPVVDYETAKKSDVSLYARYFHAMLGRGVYVAPSQLEAGFLSIMHGPSELDRTLSAMRDSLRDAVGEVD